MFQGMTDEDVPRCPWALRVKRVGIQCVLRSGHSGPHEGKLLRGSRFDRVLWNPGHESEWDTREGRPGPLDLTALW